jgi:GTP pyrophosphokinase
MLEEYRKEHNELDLEGKIQELSSHKKIAKNVSDSGVIVKGIDNCLVKLSKCCNPLPGDNIIGYITKGRGVSVHRTDCVNVKDLLNDEERLIDVYWFDDLNGSYKVEVEILANDRNGLLKDIIKQIENNKIRLTGMNSRTTKEGIAIIDLSLELENTDSLNKALSSFRNVENVYEVHRKRN